MTLSRRNIFSSIQNHLRKLVASVKYYFVFISWVRRLGMLKKENMNVVSLWREAIPIDST